MIRTLLILFFVLCVTYQALSKDFGVQGHTYTISESDLLQEIVGKLKACEEEGVLKSHQEAMVRRTQDSVRKPPPVKGITRATQAAVHYYDPSLTVPYDLKDHKGQVFQEAGKRINPLQYRSLTKLLLFIDGDDGCQVTWASSRKKARVILVGGAPFELMEAWHRPVFFDQGGTLSKKLGIQHVPAIVSQEGLRLKVEEVVVEETP